MAQLKMASAQNWLFLASLSSLLLLGGCAPAPLIVVEDLPRPPLQVPKVDVLQLDTVEWIVITEQNYQQVFDALKKQGIDPVLFGLTGNHYGRLAINTAKVRAMIQQQQALLNAYKTYYEEESAAEKNRIEKANADRKAEKKKVDEEINNHWSTRFKNMFAPDTPEPTPDSAVKKPTAPAAPATPAASVLPPPKAPVINR